MTMDISLRPIRGSDRYMPLSAHVINHHVFCAAGLTLLLPNVLFAPHLALLPAVLLVAGSAGVAGLFVREPAALADGILARPVRVLPLMGCLAIALALLVLGGEGHFFFANWDWLWRDAVLADLAKDRLLPHYQVDGQTFFLRAPLGMYLLPALVAHHTNIGIGHLVLLAQNAMMLTLTFYMMVELVGRSAVWIIVAFLSFSGLDAIGEMIVWLIQGKPITSFVLPSHIESWTHFQYSSVFTQLFWVPNHALPAYWLSVLVLLCARKDLSIAGLGLALVMCLLWSPFAVMGALPFAIYLFLRDARSAIRSPRLWLAAAIAACFTPVALYLHIDAAQVPHEFLLSDPSILPVIALFLVIEIPHVAICASVWDVYSAQQKALLRVAIGILVLLPTMRVGLANDLVMRASIPALMILAMSFGEAFKIALDQRRWVVTGACVAIAIVAGITPMQEVKRAVVFSRFAISDCDLVTVWKKLSPRQPTLDNYLAHLASASGVLNDTATEQPFIERTDRVCWPDLPYDPHAQITLLSNAMIQNVPRRSPF